ncbi:MAG: YcaO-like family protein [Methanobrevibacter sp.]|jgi:ribosomal protein S12 methylthiotransferase accessory factor|nr:YcaO-like family protein [Methanobrevibacter sp.]
MFSDIPINYFSCTHRAIDPSKTIANYEKKAKIAGITRITEITDLDRIGIPVFSAIRPTAQSGGVSVYAGKGANQDQAKASALMEGFERYSGEKHKEDIARCKIATFNQAENSGIENPIDPDEFILSNEVKNLEIATQPIEWTIATDIISEEEYHIPANAVFHPYIPKDPTKSIAIFKGNTNGLASGNVLEEAVLHGILEVIERDAWSIFELTKNKKTNSQTNKKTNNKSNNKTNSQINKKTNIKTQISLDSIENPLIKDILEKFQKNDISIKIMDLTADIAIPTILASADDTKLKDPALLTIGVGTHLNPEIAILRALTEVAQSRATQIHGTREDTSRAVLMRKAGYERMKRINSYYFKEEEEGNIKNLEEIEDKSTNSLKEDIEIAISELKENSLNKVLFTNLTRPEIGVNVVRVVIPGCEIYAVDPDRIGKRWMKFQ